MNMDLKGCVVLVTDIDRRKSIPLIRSLGKAGAQVVGISYAAFPMGGFSRYCHEQLRCPDYRVQKLAFEQFLETTCREMRPDVLIPLEDVVLEICVQKPEIWEPFTKALLPNASVLDVAYDKWQTLLAAQKAQIAIPFSACPKTDDELIDLASNWVGGAVIKPRKSSGSRGLRFVNDPIDIVSTYKEVSQEFPYPVIQSRLDSSGTGLGVCLLLDKNQNVLAIFGHERLREYPIEGGPSTLRRSYKNHFLIEKSVKLLKEIRFSGVAMVEYKIDLSTGEPVLMEINPRFWGSLHLAIAAGVNFPVLYCLSALGRPLTPVLEFQEDIYARWLIPGDLLHFIFSPNRFHLKPSFFKFWGNDLFYDELSLDDPLPTLGLIIESLQRLFEKKR
jgi:predicted ATP-grasp superfamily ATP-dependent carboligase